MTYRLFEGVKQASSYWKHRMPPPEQLMKRVLDFVEKQKGPFELAVDVGCGSGQGTVVLAKHFASVVGTDVSPAQMEMALQHSKRPNITYRQCVAEELPFADSSVDLITAMSALHWFDRPRFLQEAHRVLKPRGCLAVLNFAIEMELSYPDCCSQALNQVCNEFYAVLAPYRRPHLGTSTAVLYKESYDSIPYPDKEWHECVWVKRPMPLLRYMGLVQSFTSYQIFLKEDPQRATTLSQDICQRLMSIMGVTSADTEVDVAIRYFYFLACKPQEA